MTILEPIFASPLSVWMIPNVDADFAGKLGLQPRQRSIGLITADNDDATYVSIDEATKKADVEVVYARSFYAGARHASGPLSGEVMAVLAGPDPDEVRAGLQAAVQYLKNDAVWHSANGDGSIAFFAHLVSRTGTYLSRLCGTAPGVPVAYLVAPPMEGMVALDAALKAAAVRIAVLTPPPSETNYMGAILTGDQSACEAATAAFRDAVLEVARKPFNFQE